MKDTIHFDAPEFYRQNIAFLTVSGPNGVYHIASEGDRDAEFGEYRLLTPQHFRDAFPDGNLPEQSDTFVWRYNGWFAVYDDGEVMGDPMFSLAEAVTYALDLAYGEL